MLELKRNFYCLVGMFGGVYILSPQEKEAPRGITSSYLAPCELFTNSFGCGIADGIISIEGTPILEG
jgi:hypothetical protein